MNIDMNIRVEVRPSYEWSPAMKERGVSHRELEVFALIAQGFTNKEAAEILHIQHQSVKNHMYSLLKKLNAKAGMPALLIAIHENLVKAEVKEQGVTVPVEEAGIVKSLKELIRGEFKAAGIGPKELRKLEVFLMSHGIEIDKRLSSKGKDEDAAKG